MFPALIVFSFFIAAFFRIYPRLKLPKVYFSDTMFHLFYIREIRENNHVVPRYLDRYLRTNKNVYPFIYHWILSFFPEKAVLFFERINGAFFDLFNALIILMFLNFFSDINLSGTFSDAQKFHLIFLFLMCPLFLRLGSGPRAYNGSPRIFGQTLYILHMLSFICFAKTGSLYAAGVSSLSIGLVSMSSIFAMQVTLFFGVFLTFIFPVYPLIVLVSVAFFAFITWGRSFDVMVGAFAHSYNYIKKQKTYLYPSYRNWKKLLNQYYNDLYDIKSGKKKFSELFKTLIGDNHYIFLLVFAVPFIPLDVKVLFNSDFTLYNSFLFMWMGASLFMFFVTKHKPFLFLGEGERYLEYSVFPFLFAFVFLSGYPQWVFWSMDVAFLLLAVYFCNAYIKSYRHMDMSDKEESVLKRIDKVEEGLVLPIPNYHGKAILFHTNKTKVMVPYLMFNNRYFTKELFSFIFGNNFEYPQGNLRELVQHFNVRFILSTPTELNHYRTKLLNKEILFDNMFEFVSSDDKYCLYKLKS